MGAICSRRSTVDSSPDSHSGEMNGHQQQVHPTKAVGSESPLYKMSPNVPLTRMDKMTKDSDDFSFEAEDLLEKGNGDNKGDRKRLSRVLSEKARTARSKTTNAAKKGALKVNEVGSLLGRAGSVAVEALDTLGSSMTNLNLGSGFASGVAPKGNKIGILAFEVANTIVKGFNLKQSLSEENVRLLKEETLHSEGVQRLVSTDMAYLLRIAAADKKDELKIFAGEVVRFGNLCRDPQWHQLDRLFEKLGTEMYIVRQTKEEAEAEMQSLMNLAQYTAELYHELHALDRFETDYRRTLQEDEQFNNSQRGDGLAMLRNELKIQKKHVKNLKKRSLWSKILEEVMEKLVDAVYFLYQEILNAFEDAGDSFFNRKEAAMNKTSQKLGAASLALHYANIINQIDNLVSRPSSVTSNTRDNLYQGLPPSIKASLRNKLQNPPFREELTVPQIKAEMENILSWLVPVATNTTKVHHGFGWVGEWANTGSALDRRVSGHTDLTLLQTLHHADQEITEGYILELVVWLHHLVSVARSNLPGSKSPIKSPIRSPKQQIKSFQQTEKIGTTQNGQHVPITLELSAEDQEMLKDVKDKKFTPGISKSQEFDSSRSKAAKHSNRLSKSSSHSPSTSSEYDVSLARRHVSIAASMNFEMDRVKALDIIDRVDNI